MVILMDQTVQLLTEEGKTVSNSPPDSSPPTLEALVTLRPRRRDLPWYAVRVKPNFEHVSARMLHNKGFDEYLPVYHALRRWSDRVKEIMVPLFPQYIFCRIGRSVNSINAVHK